MQKTLEILNMMGSDGWGIVKRVKPREEFPVAHVWQGRILIYPHTDFVLAVLTLEGLQVGERLDEQRHLLQRL
jgi:hypothetical protein